MKKTLIALGITLGVIASVVGYSYLNDYLNQPSEEEIEEAKKEIEKEFLTPESKLNLIEFFPDDMPEYRMQTAIHSLVHQKVATEDSKKWGVLQITQPRVKRLLEVAELNHGFYEHGDQYISILESWAVGDFSNAVEHHNFIWNIQSGNVGKAVRLLNAVEEQEFIELHFKNNDEDTQE